MLVVCAAKVGGDKVTVTCKHPAVLVAEHPSQVLLRTAAPQHLRSETVAQVMPGSAGGVESGPRAEPLDDATQVTAGKRQAVGVHEERIAGEMLPLVEILL
jgi:hypothetical protein